MNNPQKMEICLTLNVIHTNMRESSNYHDVSERFIYIFLVVGPMGMISENRPKQWIDKDSDLIKRNGLGFLHVSKQI